MKSQLFVYTTRFGLAGKQKIWTLYANQFVDIRYDYNNDGLIDQWHLSRGRTQIDAFFSESKLKQVKFWKRFKDRRITLTYNLQNNRFVLFSTNIENNTESYYSSSPNQAICESRKLSNFFKDFDWNEITADLSRQQTERNWIQAIGSSCNNAKPALNEAVLDVLSLDHNGNVSQNLLLNCLANSSANKIVPSFIRIALIGPIDDPPFKINCEKIEFEQCSKRKPSYSHNSNEIKLQISTPPCQQDQREYYRRIVRHEIGHALMPELDETAIEDFMSKCEKGEIVNLTESSLLQNTNQNGGHLSQAQERRNVASHAQINPTDLQQEFPASSLAIPTPPNGTAPSGYVALNEGFKQSGSGATAYVPRYEAASRAMSFGFFNMANQLFAKIPAAAAGVASTVLASGSATTAPSRTIAVPSASFRSSGGTSSSADGGNSDTLANEEITVPSSVGVVSSAPIGIGSPKPTSELGVSGNNSAGGAAASAGNRGIASAGAGGSSLQRADSGSSAPGVSAKVQPPVSAKKLSPQQIQMSSKLEGMSIDEAREFIDKHNLDLVRMKIHISSPNTSPGFPIAEEADIVFREVNKTLKKVPRNTQ